MNNGLVCLLVLVEHKHNCSPNGWKLHFGSFSGYKIRKTVRVPTHVVFPTDVSLVLQREDPSIFSE